MRHLANEAEHGYKWMSCLCYFYEHTNVSLTFKVQDTWISKKEQTFLCYEVTVPPTETLLKQRQLTCYAKEKEKLIQIILPCKN